MRLRTSRACVRTSRPKIRAVPAVGRWKPSSVLIRVDLPAPFGPSRPIDLPVSLALSFFRMVRLPKRTSSPSNSMTGTMPLFKRMRAAGSSHHLSERNGALQTAGNYVARTDAHQVAGGRDADAVG